MKKVTTTDYEAYLPHPHFPIQYSSVTHVSVTTKCVRRKEKGLSDSIHYPQALLLFSIHIPSV